MSRNGMRRVSRGAIIGVRTVACAAAAALSPFTQTPRCAHAFAPPTVIPAAPPAAAIAPTVPTGPLRVVFGGVPLPVAKPELAPYRDPTDGEVCVSPASLAPLGVTYAVDARAGMATFVAIDGTVNVTVPLRTPPPADASGIEGRVGPFVAAAAVIEGLGGKCEWDAKTNTLMARAVLTSVEMIAGQLRIKATLPVTPTIIDQQDGRRIVIDVVGAEVGKLPHTLDLQSSQVAAARAGQFRSNVARVVLEMKQPSAFAVLGGKPSTQMILNPALPSSAPPAPISITIPPRPASSVAATGGHTPASGTHGKKAPAPPPVSVVSGVTFHKVSDNEAQFTIAADRAPTLRAALAKGRLTLDLLNATLGAKAADLADFDHPFLKAVHLIATGGSAAQLVVDLTRTVVYTLRPSDKGPIELDLSLPRGAVGKLSGKTVVVDAGHGGHDSGARGVNGTNEKDVALQIATQFADALRDAGANVILTRSRDYFIPVDDRPQIANKSNADFFVSIHCDSGDRNHSVQGSTVYYHFNQPSCRALAQSIADRLSGTGDIHSRGIGSDGIRFPGQGYGVLRNSRMVAVLCECGYMSNGEDVRKLTNPSVQKKIAASIVAGLRDYIEGNPQIDTRDVNPQAGNGSIVVPPPAQPLPNADPNTPDNPTGGGNGGGTAPNAPTPDKSTPPAGDMPATPAASPTAMPQDDSIDGSNISTIGSAAVPY